MKNYERLFKGLTPKDKDAIDDKSDIILALGNDSTDAEWESEYNDFIKEYPSSVPAKKKVSVSKQKIKEPKAKSKGKKPTDEKSDLDKIREARKKKSKTEKEAEKAKKDKEIQTKISADKKVIEDRLNKIYNDFNSADPIKKMELSVTKSIYKIKEKKAKKPEEPKAQRYGEKMQEQHDKLIGKRAGMVTNAAIYELSRTKESESQNSKLIQVGKDISNAMTVIASDIDDHLMRKHTHEAEIISKGFKALVIASISHENLTEKFKNRPKALQALEDLKCVIVERKKDEIVKISISPKIEKEVKVIRENIKKITEAIHFKKGGSINSNKVWEAKIIFKGGIDPEIYLIAQEGYSGNDEEIFFYVENEKELKSLMNKDNKEDFILLNYKEAFAKGGDVGDDILKYIKGLKHKGQMLTDYPQTYELLSEEFNNEIINELGEDANNQDKFDKLLYKKIGESSDATIMVIVQNSLVDEF